MQLQTEVVVGGANQISCHDGFCFFKAIFCVSSRGGFHDLHPGGF